MITSLIFLVRLIFKALVATARNIHLAADNRLERRCILHLGNDLTSLHRIKAELLLHRFKVAYHGCKRGELSGLLLTKFKILIGLFRSSNLGINSPLQRTLLGEKCREVAMLALQREHLVEQLLERLLARSLRAIHLADIVHKLLDGEHIAVVGNGKARHAVLDSLIDKLFDTRLTIKYRVLGVSMKVYETTHIAAVVVLWFNAVAKIYFFFTKPTARLL